MSRMLWIILAIIAGAALILMFNTQSGTTLGFLNEDFANLIWLGILATVIGAGLLGSGHRVSEMARSLGLWVLIVLALVAGYQYRYEIQDFGSRITAGLIPGSPLMLGLEDGRATVVLDKGRNGHFAVRMEVNGKPVQAIIDTGATTTVLSSEAARAIGFDPQSLHYTVQVSTANGTANAAAIRVDDITIGNITRRNLPVLVAAPGALQQSLLGMNFIGSLSGFDVRGDRMILRD
ncbi:TIGR02281 family clan AA aspartic protease [Aquamicrobium segne]|uniref:TIGR02281 family clan AA aspartic protease n=1 Tax=Aquamicrobium segne TaxID=469547 RepID=A0ABW0GVL9_9HYPH